MRIRIKHLTTLLMITLFLLAGCGGCRQKPPEQVEQPADAPKDETPIPQVEIEQSEKTDTAETPTEPTPKLSRDQLPDALPYPMTQENRHIWEALVTEAANDTQLMQHILPDTIELAHQTHTHLSNTNIRFEKPGIFFMEAMWRNLEQLYPNNGDVLRNYIRYCTRFGPRASRAEKQHFVATWERLKKINDADGLSPGHHRRHTYYLTRTYVELGEFDKALENVKDELTYYEAAKRERPRAKRLDRGLELSPWMVNKARELHEAKLKKEKTQEK